MTLANALEFMGQLFAIDSVQVVIYILGGVLVGGWVIRLLRSRAR